MCYAAVTKGLTALATVSLAAARAYGVDRELAAEMAASQRMLSDRFERALPDMAPKDYRWVARWRRLRAPSPTSASTPSCSWGLPTSTGWSPRPPSAAKPPQIRRADWRESVCQYV